VTLTDVGRPLLEKARSLDQAAGDFFETAGRMAPDDTVRVGIAWGLWDSPNRVRIKAAKQVAGLTIEASDDFCPDTFHEQLRNRTLDLVFARPPFDLTAFNTAPLFQERLVAVVSDDSSLAARKSVRIKELASEP